MKSHDQLVKEVVKDITHAVGKKGRGLWASVVSQCDIVVANSINGQEIPTAATDGSFIGFNPDWYFEKSPAEREVVILHEILHIVRGDPWMREWRDPAGWNKACDYALATLLKNPNMVGHIPEDHLYDPLYTEQWSAERIYDHLYGGKNEEELQKPSGKGNGGDQQGSPVLGNGDQSSNAGQSNQTEEDYSYSHGEVWDATGDNGEPLTPEQKEQALADLAEVIERGVTFAGNDEGGGLKSHIAKLRRPNAPWTRKVSLFVSKKGQFSGRSYRKFDRRGACLDLFLPGKQFSGIKSLALLLDVSSSVDERRLQALLSHVDALRGKVHIEEIHVAPFTSVCRDKNSVKVRGKEKLPRSYRIGGGTNFRSAFNWVKSHCRKAEAIIVFTDLGCDDYGKKPKAPVLWVSSDPVHEYNRPPWGQVVEIDCL